MRDTCESFFTYECVFQTLWIHVRDFCHVTHMNVSFQTCGYMCEIVVSHVTHVIVSFKHCGYMFEISVLHVAHMNVSFQTCGYMFEILVSHVTHVQHISE